MRGIVLLLFLISFSARSQTYTNEIFPSRLDSLSMGIIPNYTSVWKDGTVRSYGNATTWDDLFFPFQTGKAGSADYPAFVADSGYWNFTAVDTTGPSICVMSFTVQIPHRYREGSAIHPHVHYRHETAVGTPKFVFKYKWFNIGATIPATWSRYNMSTTTGTTNYSQQMAYGAAAGISGTGKTISSILLVQVFLYATPVNVKAYQMDVHFEIDGLGSRTETAK